MRGPTHRVEPVWRSTDLPGRGGAGELLRIGPHQQGQSRARGVPGRQVERTAQRDAVLPRVAEALLDHALHLWRRIGERRQREPGPSGPVAVPGFRFPVPGFCGERAQHVVGRRRARLMPRQQTAAIARDDRDDLFELLAAAPEQARRRSRAKRDLVGERAVAVRRRSEAQHVDAALVRQHGIGAGARVRRTWIGVGILGRSIRQHLHLALAWHHREARPAGRAVVLADQGLAGVGPRHGAAAKLRAVPRHGRHAGRQRERHQLVTVGHDLLRVAAVEGLQPREPGRCGRIPPIASWAGGDAADRHRVCERQRRQRVDLGTRHVDHADALREVVVGHQPRERTTDLLDQEEAPARRRRRERIQARGSDDARGAPGGRNQGDRAGGVMREERLVVRTGEQILIGPHGRGRAARLLDVGPGWRGRRTRFSAAGRRRRQADETGAVGHPRAFDSERGAESHARHLPGGAGLRVDEPQLHVIGPHHREGVVRAIRCVPDGQEAVGASRRQRHWSRRLPVEACHGHGGVARASDRRARGRREANAGQTMDGLGQFGDRRHRARVQEHETIGGGREDGGRHRCGVEDRGDRRRRHTVRGGWLRQRRRGQGKHHERSGTEAGTGHRLASGEAAIVPSGSCTAGSSSSRP